MDTVIDYVQVSFLFLSLVIILFLLYKLIARLNVAKENRGLLVGILSLIIFSSLYLTRSYWLPWFSGSPDVYTFAGKILGTLWWLSLAMVITQGADFFLWKGIFLRRGELVVPKILTDIITVFIYMVISAAILRYVYGKPIVALAATSGVMALILGYSAQNTIADVFAGVGLNLSKCFHKGDWINVDGMVGKVADMNWRYVTLETIYENHLTIPNSLVANSRITNYNRPEKYRGDTFIIQIEHGLSPDRAQQLILESAADSEHILDDPKPEVSIDEYGDSGIHYELWYYTFEPDDYYIKRDVFRALWYRLRNEGVQISLSDIAAHRPLGMPPKDIDIVANLLKNVEIFKPLNDTEIKILADKVRRIEYGPPERVVIQGDKGSSMYIVEKGRLDVSVRQEDGEDLSVAKLSAGSIFGEMTLLTGEPRTATVRTLSDVVAYEITKDEIEPIFKSRPELVDQISDLKERRLKEKEEKEREYRETAKEEKEEKSIGRRLAQRIKDFFSL